MSIPSTLTPQQRQQCQALAGQMVEWAIRQPQAFLSVLEEAERLYYQEHPERLPLHPSLMDLVEISDLRPSFTMSNSSASPPTDDCA